MRPADWNPHELETALCDALTGDALTGDALTGDASAETEGTGNLQVLLMGQALESYRAETLRWAEERSATLPVCTRPKRTPWLRARWVLASAAIVACAGGAWIHLHLPANAVPVSEPTAQVLSQDESLLQSVDAALDGSERTPTEEELGLTETVDGTHTPRHVEDLVN